jgi:hypothetical protein
VSGNHDFQLKGGRHMYKNYLCELRRLCQSFWFLTSILIRMNIQNEATPYSSLIYPSICCPSAGVGRGRAGVGRRRVFILCSGPAHSCSLGTEVHKLLEYFSMIECLTVPLLLQYYNLLLISVG